MTRMNRLALLGTLSFSLVVGGAILATTLRAADQKAADAAKKDLLSADDFWESTGKQNNHQFDDATLSLIKQTVADQNATAARRLRANKLACDLARKTRLRDDIGAEQSNAAIAVAMKYLEANLADGTVKCLSPENGFTHITVTEKLDDAAGIIWVLIESVESDRGLNIRVDPATHQVTKVVAWGKPQAAAENNAPAEKNAPWFAKFSFAVADGKDKIAIQKELSGEAGKPVHIDAGDAYGVDLEIQPQKSPDGVQFVATMKVSKAGTVVSMPRLAMLADQEGVITIESGKEKSLTASLTISEKPGPAPRAATVPTGRAPLGR